MDRSGWCRQGTLGTDCPERPWGRRRRPVSWRMGRTPGSTCLPGRPHMSPHWQPAHRVLHSQCSDLFTSRALSQSEGAYALGRPDNIPHRLPALNGQAQLSGDFPRGAVNTGTSHLSLPRHQHGEVNTAVRIEHILLQGNEHTPQRRQMQWGPCSAWRSWHCLAAC